MIAMRKLVWALLLVSMIIGIGAQEAQAGSKIAFEGKLDPVLDNGQVFVMDSNGSNLTNISDNAFFEGNPSWSPDGSKIAFYSDRDGTMDIYVMDPDGSNVTRLTTGIAGDNDGFPIAWSPELPAQVSAISVGGTYALVFMMGVLAALMMVKRQQREPETSRV